MPRPEYDSLFIVVLYEMMNLVLIIVWVICVVQYVSANVSIGYHTNLTFEKLTRPFPMK